MLATGSRPAPPEWAVPGVYDVRQVLSGAVEPTGPVLVYDELGHWPAASVAELLAARGRPVELVTPAMVVAQEPELREQDFIFKAQPISTAAPADKSLDEVERVHILRMLEECGGNQSRAAEILGIDRVTLHHKLKRYGWTRIPVETR